MKNLLLKLKDYCNKHHTNDATLKCTCGIGKYCDKFFKDKKPYEWNIRKTKKIEKIKRCFNCGEMPIYKFQAKAREKHVLKHNALLCPYRYETHQKTKFLVIKDWNEWIEEKSKV